MNDTRDQRPETSSKGYRNLLAWEKTDRLAHLVYDITKEFPRSELFALTSQMRRAAVSVPANIAEGYCRRGGREKKQFYQIALSSLTELEFYIDFSFERRYFERGVYTSLVDSQSESARLLTGLIRSVK